MVRRNLLLQIVDVGSALDEAGADAFISKPFTVPELQHKLKKHVDRAQLLRSRKDREKLQTAGAAPQASSGGWLGKILG